MGEYITQELAVVARIKPQTVTAAAEATSPDDAAAGPVAESAAGEASPTRRRHARAL